MALASSLATPRSHWHGGTDSMVMYSYYYQCLVMVPDTTPIGSPERVQLGMGNRPVSNHLMLFEPDVTPTQPEHGNTNSTSSELVTDCLLDSGNDWECRGGRHPVFACMKDKGDQDSEITFILRESDLCGAFCRHTRAENWPPSSGLDIPLD
ncbi:hypothetical protein PAXINDRAFT_158452 [Paxillus involutus ATCC 200175]|uniref:Unplaced genomic scaffold PAXINscaffold_606, whole genome shotgun sequence n=1 Tax=Paxillus involutus ATCC 200175 TaxID=664439 RepID=A0A0C9T843_PAXIN|nr:hypothetical protein PAXINDRAFT_158452 [Paxillus involutus ATCC 200175]